MVKLSLFALALTGALGACATVPAPSVRPLGIGPAPITFDGHVAAQATDYVFVLVPDANPVTPGLALKQGERLRVRLPAEFKRDTSVAIRADADTNLVLTKGWPQGAVKLAGQYRVDYDVAAHAISITATADIAPVGSNAPGIKVIHLRGRTFTNPFPGDYAATVDHLSADGAVLATWAGRIPVLDDAPKARVAPTNFHLPPGTGADFQTAALGETMPHLLGLLLWGESASPLNGVGIAPRDLQRFPRYTGGLLVQDRNGDKILDPATDQVVGGIIGAAPEGARGQSATSPRGADGKPVLSGEMARHAGFPAAGGGGQPNPGLLPVLFRVGDRAGEYRPTFELIDGNSVRFTLTATTPR